ncbi:hypothetical protein ACFWXO_22980 [Kitasatospora sp. NPDC059088]|uniref:hypothetical protein n=1 Tax=Kitasatospora sp. NPDC059088 TaxID=3346722 RepID=UPI0036CC1263
MSVDADLHLRWPDGLAPTTGELAALLGLRYGADGGPWGEATAPDGRSTMRIRISTDPADLLGPRPGRGAEHRYDHCLLLTTARREPYPLDTYAVLRAHARETITLLRPHGLIEAAFGIDSPGADDYWTAARTLLAPEPADIDLTLCWGTETPTQHTTRYTGRQITPDQLDTFADHLTATLTRPGEQLDLTLRLGPHLLRHQTATQPPTDLRLLP